MALKSRPDIEVSLFNCVDCEPEIRGGWKGMHAALRKSMNPRVFCQLACWFSILARPLPPFPVMSCPPYIPYDPNMAMLRLVLLRGLVPCLVV